MKKYVLKIVILLSTLYAVVRLAHWPLGFTFFTQLSNLFAAGIVLAQIITKESRRLLSAKYAAAVSIAITFLVYLLVLAPLTPGGFLAAYSQDHWASLCLHVVTPLCCVADFLINDAPARAWHGRDLALACLPPVGWLFLILILGRLGLRWHGMTAPYPFLNYSAPAGWFGILPETAGETTLGIGVAYAIALMLGLFLTVGFALMRLANRRGRKA